MKFRLIIVIILANFNCYSQSMNQLDSLGRRQGFWRSTQNSLTITEYYRNDSLNGEKMILNNETVLYFVEYKMGKLNGFERKYNLNGKIVQIANYRNDELTFLVKFHINGMIKEENYFKNSRLNNYKRVYYRNGKIRQESQYKDGLLHGNEKYYKKNGKVTAVMSYSMGVLINSW